VALGSFIVTTAYEKDVKENFRSIYLTLKSKPEFNTTFAFYVNENENRYILSDFGFATVNKKEVMKLSKNDKIEILIKSEQAKNFVDKINSYLGIINIYGLKFNAKNLLNINDYIKYREKDNSSFAGYFMYILMFCLTLMSIHWLICMSICLLNSDKIDDYSKSKWCNPLVFRNTEDKLF
jgi:hypothetical protein